MSTLLTSVAARPEADAVSRWAAAMLEPGAAVILDVETTGIDGAIVEVAVVDASTGEPVLDTLVNPGSVAIEPEARAVHGIGADDVADAPTWPEVLPELLRVTTGKRVIAYNAAFDSGRVAADSARYGLDAAHLVERGVWACLMLRRSIWLGTDRWMRLGGGHRALGDTLAARDVLIGLTLSAPCRAVDAADPAAGGRVRRWIRRVLHR